jgi:hypothetical protein
MQPALDVALIGSSRRNLNAWRESLFDRKFQTQRGNEKELEMSGFLAPKTAPVRDGD